MEQFLQNLMSNYADIVNTFAMPMIIGLFAFALPLVFQVISNIDEKYDSTLLIKAFRKDWICKWFIASLIIAILFCILWTLQLKRCESIDINKVINLLIDNSAIILLTISTIILIISTFFLVWLMYVYYLPEKLFNRLEKQYYGAKNEEDRAFYYEAVSKILFYSIKKEGEPLSRELQQFYVDEFIRYRKDKTNETIVYPDYFYNVMFDANERICQRKKKSISMYNSSICKLFIDEYQHTIISEKTYTFLWRCLCQTVIYEKYEFAYSYWQLAHQYMNFGLTKIYPKYGEDLKTVINQEEINKRNEERTRFLEFHYAFCGYLMKEEKYKLLSQLMWWTNQEPPKYFLVPNTMQEVVLQFMQVEKNAGIIPMYYEVRYQYPNVYGVSADGIIKMWIKRYIAILFLRQYIIRETYFHSRALSMPEPPKGLSEKRDWITELDLLNKLVDEYLNNKECLEAFGLGDLYDREWFKNNNKPKPKEIIKNFKQKVTDSSEQAKKEQEIDESKRDEFYDNTKNILGKCLKEYTNLFPEQNDLKSYKSLHYHGRYGLQDKMAFAKEQDMGYANSDSIGATLVSVDFKHNFPSIFKHYYKNTNYLLEEEDLFVSIDKLQLSKDDYTIVSVGINVESYPKIYLNGKLKKEEDRWFYNNIPIIVLESSKIDAVSESLFIVNNKDLPSIVCKEIDKNIVTKYELNQINEQYHIYASLIDLNNNKEIAEEVKEKLQIDDVAKSVLVCVDMEVEVQCNSEAKCIQLQMFSQFTNQGTPSKPEDVKNIWK